MQTPLGSSLKKQFEQSAQFIEFALDSVNCWRDDRTDLFLKRNSSTEEKRRDMDEMFTHSQGRTRQRLKCR